MICENCVLIRHNDEFGTWACFLGGGWLQDRVGTGKYYEYKTDLRVPRSRANPLLKRLCVRNEARIEKLREQLEVEE